MNRAEPLLQQPAAHDSGHHQIGTARLDGLDSGNSEFSRLNLSGQLGSGHWSGQGLECHWLALFVV